MPSLPLPSNLSVYKRVAGANPAAGSEVSDTVPAGKWWWLISVTVQLVQGITQTPLPALVIDDGATTILESWGSTAAQAVSTTTNYTWADSMNLTGQIGLTPNFRSMAPIPSMLLIPPGFRIRTVTQGIGANSDYGVPSYFVCELG